MSRPSTHAATAATGEVARQAPPAEQQHGHHQQADRPQRRELVEDQEERLRAGGDRVEQPDDGFLGRGGMVRVQDQRHQQQRGEHGARGVAGSPPRRALGAFTRRDLAQVVHQRPDRSHLPPCHARPPSHSVSRLGGAAASG